MTTKKNISEDFHVLPSDTSKNAAASYKQQAAKPTKKQIPLPTLGEKPLLAQTKNKYSIILQVQSIEHIEKSSLIHGRLFDQESRSIGFGILINDAKKTYIPLDGNFPGVNMEIVEESFTARLPMHVTNNHQLLIFLEDAVLVEPLGKVLVKQSHTKTPNENDHQQSIQHQNKQHLPILPCPNPVILNTPQGKAKAGLMLEKISYTQDKLSLLGWSFNSSQLILKAGGQTIAAKLQNYSRLDVAHAYSIAEQQDAELGFILVTKPCELTKDMTIVWKVSDGKGYQEMEFLLDLENIEIDSSEIDLLSTNQDKSSISLNPSIHQQLNTIEERLPKSSDSVLIVGSAPTIERYISQIEKFKGERWALNGAWFWLEKQGIHVDKVFITDTRFIQKSLTSIEKAQCSTMVTIDTVKLNLIQHVKKNVYSFKSLGRDGFSIRYGEVFHGCSVFFSALQTALAQQYQKVACCGVMFPPPTSYVRIDGSHSMPEYVHVIQLHNAQTSLDWLIKFDMVLDVFEPESNLNFI